MNQKPDHYFDHVHKAQIQEILTRIAEHGMGAHKADVREAGTVAAVAAYTAEADCLEGWNYCTPDLIADVYQQIAAVYPEDDADLQALGGIISQIAYETEPGEIATYWTADCEQPGGDEEHLDCHKADRPEFDNDNYAGEYRTGSLPLW